MEEKDDVTPDFLRGFNDGYYIGKHDPQIADTLSAMDLKTDRMSGIKAGLSEAAKEKKLSLLPKWMEDHQKPKEEKSDKKDIDLDRE